MFAEGAFQLPDLVPGGRVAAGQHSQQAHDVGLVILNVQILELANLRVAQPSAHIRRDGRAAIFRAQQLPSLGDYLGIRPGLLNQNRSGFGALSGALAEPQALFREKRLFVEMKRGLDLVHQIAGAAIPRQGGKQNVQVPADVLIPVHQVFHFLGRSPRAAANLRVDLVQIVVFQIVVSLIHPEDFL